MQINPLAVVGVALLGTAAVALLVGRARSRQRTRLLHQALRAAQQPLLPSTYDPHVLDGLPEPVQRYFRTVLVAGQPMIAAVRLLHAGQFNLSEQRPHWRRFSSTQQVTTRPPGFDWEGQIRMVPGLTVTVHDAYVAGEGILHAELFGLITVAAMRGSPEAATGELLRYLAEAAWYPTALLPGQGVEWSALDDTAARAAVTDGTSRVAIDFHFNPDGTIGSFRAAGRIRKVVDGVAQYAPWQGRFSDYQVRDGMQIPLVGEVAWELPGGLAPYYRGTTVEVEYEFAR